MLFMESGKDKQYMKNKRQVEAVRKIYSGIGQPLAVDVIVDLYLHIGKAMELAGSGVFSPGKRDGKPSGHKN